jgi:hypothetical protein
LPRAGRLPPRGAPRHGTPISADCPVYAAAPAGTLTAAEADGLIYMREEEKLAHDVYVTLGAQWSLPIFANIAASEQTHTDAVLALLERYGIDDPAAGNGVGVFTTRLCSRLYDRLVAQGSQSLGDALKVGAVIEEIDILDLQSRETVTVQADILQVFDNLEQASTNHLRSFVSTLAGADRRAVHAAVSG